MPTRIGLLSDTHATTAPLRDALAILHRHEVDTIICAGDIAGYGADQLEPTVALLQEHHCRSIAGNHDLFATTTDKRLEPTSEVMRFLQGLPHHLELTIQGKSIVVIHASPLDAMHGGIKLLAADGEVIPERMAYWEEALHGFAADVLVVGHTHQVFAETIGRILVINPGSTAFNHTCCILTLPEMRVETFALLNKTPVKTWNWGLLHSEP